MMVVIRMANRSILATAYIPLDRRLDIIIIVRPVTVVVDTYSSVRIQIKINENAMTHLCLETNV